MKKIAVQLVADHTAALNGFKKLAAARHLQVRGNGKDVASSMSPISVPKGGSFDATWASLMLTMHNDKIAELERMISQTTDSELRTLCTQVLQKVRLHRDMLQKVPGAKEGLGTNEAIH